MLMQMKRHCKTQLAGRPVRELFVAGLFGRGTYNKGERVSSAAECFQLYLASSGSLSLQPIDRDARLFCLLMKAMSVQHLLCK